MADKGFNLSDLEKSPRPDLPIILKIGKDTDVRVNLRKPQMDEKVLKVSNACKTRTWWFKSLFLGESKYYYKYFCLTTDRFFMINVMFDKSYGSWEANYEKNFNVSIKDLVSAYSSNIKGKNWLVVNYKYLGKNYQTKLPVENPDGWVNEINAVIEKAR